ncbi:MAG: phage portal protein [Actinomycetota bacterium]
MTLGDAIKRATVSQLVESSSDAALAFMGAPPTASGITVNEDTAMRFSAIFRARAIVAGVTASLPLKVYEGDESARQRVRGTIVDAPHPDMTPFEFYELLVDRVVAHGNFYGLKYHDMAGRLRYVEPIHPRHAKPYRDRDRRTASNPFGKVFDITDADGNVQRGVTSADIFHIPSISLDGVQGLSVIGLARQGIGLALAAEEYGGRLFANGTLVGGMITTDAALSPVKAQRIRARWRQVAAGLRNAHDVAVLDNGAKYQRLDMPPEDAQFIESRGFQVREAARWFGLPPFTLADFDSSSNWGTGLEQQQIVTLIYTFGQLLQRISQRISAEWLNPAGRFAEHDVAGFLRTDFKSTLEALVKGRQWGIFEGNEARQRINLPSDPAIGGWMIPQNMTVVGGPDDADPDDQDPDAPNPAPA